jgi:hypothetical protein
MNIEEIAARRAASDSVAKSVKALKEAEALQAKREPREFIVNYRLSTVGRSAKGSYNDRLTHLKALIGALDGLEEHASTSTWVIKSRRSTTELVLTSLAVALDKKIDFLSVAQVGPRKTFGTVDLEE